MMYRLTATMLLSSIVAGCSPTSSASSTRAGAAPPAEPIFAQQALSSWRASVDSLQQAAVRLDSAAHEADDASDVARLRDHFREARRHFKQSELALEYYAPTTSRELNGPPVPEVEEDEGPEVIHPPVGFQVIEAILFGADPLQDREALLAETGTLREVATRARSMLAVQETTDAHVWDAARLELARLLTLGIASFDASVSGDALVEGDAALEGIRRSLAPYVSTSPEWDRLQQAISDARATLRSSEGIGQFNFLAFIASRGQPLAHALASARSALGIELPADRRAFRMEAASLYDANAFDAVAFAPPGSDQAPDARRALGEFLFRDSRLSTRGTRSCQSCHDPNRGFTDGRPRAVGLDGRTLARNTPSVINSGLQVGSFADLRATFLEDQITDVVENPAEMHGSLNEAARTLASDPTVRETFRRAFPANVSPDSVITSLRIRQALAAYLRSLVALATPVDRALRGDTLALSREARAGFNLFVGKGRCASCHFLPLTNGTVPPMYLRSEVEVLGVPARAVRRGGTIDPDLGRFLVSRSTPHRYAFRTPGLRNVALTAPYMHNGAYATLEEVVTFYNLGGGAGIGATVPNQTLPAEPLHLSTQETRELVALLRSLSDSSSWRSH